MIAVGTTVVRALETVVGDDGTVHAGAGWTNLVIEPDRELGAVDGLITGWHEPEASHLMMLEAIGGAELLERSYARRSAAAICGTSSAKPSDPALTPASPKAPDVTRAHYLIL